MDHFSPEGNPYHTYHSKDGSLAEVSKAKAEDKAKLIKSLEELKLQDPFYDQVARSAYDYLWVKLYSSDTPPPPRPLVFVIPESQRETVKNLQLSTRSMDKIKAGVLLLDLDIIVVYSSGAKYLDTLKICHEIFHDLARKDLVYDGKKTAASKVGFRTAKSPNHESGSMLEEGLAEYEGREYFVNRFKRDFPSEYQALVSELQSNYGNRSLNSLIHDQIDDVRAEPYYHAEMVVQNLIEIIKERHPLGTIFEYLLLQSRANPNRTREVVSMIDDVLGVKLRRQIFSFNMSNLEKMIDLQATLHSMRQQKART